MRILPVFFAFALFLSGCAGGGDNGASAASHYSHRMHNRFYEAWVQPTNVSLRHGKVALPVEVIINAQGHVLSFHLLRSSGDSAVDASIRAVGQRVTEVAPPPAAPFRLKIFFELDVR